MSDNSIDILSIDRGAIAAPAGCGKTHLIADALKRHAGSKPILVLTHTNSGVAALRSRLNDAGVSPKIYRIFTIDGWVMRIVSAFPNRSDCPSDMLKPASNKIAYEKIRTKAMNFLASEHINDIIVASYVRLIVDEYQDCCKLQHEIISFIARLLPTCVLGDPLQAIFGFRPNQLPKWDEEVCSYFPVKGTLENPWRWINAGKEDFGYWLLDCRNRLISNQPIDLKNAPQEVTWVHLDGTEDMARQINAARTAPAAESGRVLIIGKSTSPESQQNMASKVPGAVTVESVDLRDFVEYFARDFDFHANGALEKLVRFAGRLMTNVKGPELMGRIQSLQRGTAHKSPSEVEQSALDFCSDPSPKSAANLLSKISKGEGVRQFRPAVFKSCIKALEQCDGADSDSFYDAAVRIREQNRLIGRPLAKRSVGSTLLLKGLEADVCVILDAHELNARNLYVAMTRGSHRLVICSRAHILNP